MDEIVENPLSHIPMHSLSLRLTRATIKMVHDRRWRVDKVNPVHDLILCLSGEGRYHIGDAAEPITLRPGMALLIPAFTRFRGAHGGGAATYIGLAQHFSLDLFGRGDLIRQMHLAPAAALPRWDILAPLAAHYRESAPHGSTTLAQHHAFMVLLLAFLERAFQGWRTQESAPEGQQDMLSVQIMLAAARLSTDPLGSGIEEALANVPYNPDYFRRAFKERLGHTPAKFRELKRMEFAANRLGQGLSVKAVAAELGYEDPYFFSRMFKRYLGVSPSIYREKRSDSALEQT
jgi:AraC-like DNA-binding protein